MKIAFAIVVLIVLANVGYFYASSYVLGGIEAGMGGGHGKFKDYHEGNAITSYFTADDSASASSGSVSENPFVGSGK